MKAKTNWFSLQLTGDNKLKVNYSYLNVSCQFLKKMPCHCFTFKNGRERKKMKIFFEAKAIKTKFETTKEKWKLFSNQVAKVSMICCPLLGLHFTIYKCAGLWTHPNKNKVINQNDNLSKKYSNGLTSSNVRIVRTSQKG